jgi:hypothetical protein
MVKVPGAVLELLTTPGLDHRAAAFDHRQVNLPSHNVSD